MHKNRFCKAIKFCTNNAGSPKRVIQAPQLKRSYLKFQKFWIINDFGFRTNWPNVCKSDKHTLHLVYIKLAEVNFKYSNLGLGVVWKVLFKFLARIQINISSYALHFVEPFVKSKFANVGCDVFLQTWRKEKFKFHSSRNGMLRQKSSSGVYAVETGRKVAKKGRN